MADERGTTRTGTRTDAASMIAELWAEREQASPPPAPAAPASGRAPKSSPPRPAAPRPKASGTERALAVAVALLLLGGAAGAAAVTTGFVGAPSKTTFIAQADAICGPGNAGVTALTKPTGYPTLVTAASTLVGTTDAQLAGLRALELPGGAERGRTRAVLDAMTATNAAGRNLQTAAGATDDRQTVAAARLMSTYSKDAVAKAKAYGFAACATGMQPGIEAVLGGASGAVKNSFVAKATTRCLTAMEAVTSLAKPKTGPELSRFVAESTAMFDKLTVDMKALPVAPGDEGTVAEMFVAVEKANAKMKEVGAAAVAGDLKRMNTLQKEFDALDDAAGAKLEGYGLNVCGYNT